MKQPFYSKASVQVAIVSALALLTVTAATIAHQRSVLATSSAQLAHDRQALYERVQTLETQLTPFRTIALQKYAGPEGEALKQLAESIKALNRAVSDTQLKIASGSVAASYPKMRELLNIRPTGLQIIRVGDSGGPRMDTRLSSPVALMMPQFYNAVITNNPTGASEAIDSVVATLPNWPYGLYFRGAVFGHTNDLVKAAEEFLLARNTGVHEPEALLYEALSRASLGEYDAASQLLDELRSTGGHPSEMGLMFASRGWPSNLLQRIQTLATEMQVTLFISN